MVYFFAKIRNISFEKLEFINLIKLPKMNFEFYNRIATSSAATESRNSILGFVIENLNFITDLASIAFDVKDKNHYKAVWIIEMIAEINPVLLIPYLDTICETLSEFKNHSAVRGMSRTVYFISTSKEITLTKTQEEKIIETSMDWLIGDARIAPKVFAMRTLSEFSTQYQWIKEALKNVLSENYSQQSAGYKAAARAVLKSIN